MRRVEVSGRREHGGPVELAMALDVACHAVDKMSHGDAGIGIIGVRVDNRRVVNGAAGGEGPHALVPMNMAREGVSIWISDIFFFCKLTQQGMHQHHIQA